MSTEFDKGFMTDDIIEADHIQQLFKPVEDLESGASNYREATGSGSNYVVDFQKSANPDGNFLSALVPGQVIVFKANDENNQNASLTVNLEGGGSETHPIKIGDNSVKADVIKEDQVVCVIYTEEGGANKRFELVGSTGILSNLAPGSNGQYLRMGSSSPYWSTLSYNARGYGGTGGTRLATWTSSDYLSYNSSVYLSGYQLTCGTLKVSYLPIYSSSGANLYAYTSGNKGYLHHWSSSRKHKKNIRTMDGVKSKLKQLRPVRYEGTAPKLDANGELELDEDGNPDVQYEESFGLIAEEVAELFPDLTYQIRLEDGTESMGVHYNRIPIYNVQAMIELQEEVDELRARLDQLEARGKK